MALTVAELLALPEVREQRLPLEAFATTPLTAARTPVATLRYWITAGLLVSVGVERRPVGRPVKLYRVGDVVDLRQGNRRRLVAS